MFGVDAMRDIEFPYIFKSMRLIYSTIFALFIGQSSNWLHLYLLPASQDIRRPDLGISFVQQKL